MRRRARVLLTEEDLHYLLALVPGERMVTAWPDPVRNGIVIGIEGDETTGLAEVAEGAESPRIERPYAMAKLRERLLGIVAAHVRLEGGLSDECLVAIGRRVVEEVFPSLLTPGPDVP